MSNILIVVQARMESMRFPGKILAPLCGQPMLLWLLQRLSTLPYKLIVACPDTPANATVAALCQDHGYTCVLVPTATEDVLGRFACVTRKHQHMRRIVRVGADTPLLDPQVITQLVTHNLYAEYVGLGAGWGDGVADSEVFARTTLLAAAHDATQPYEREHVSPFIFEHPERFACQYLHCPFDLSHLRCSVDTPEDLRYTQMILQRCLDHYGFGFGWKEVYWTVERDSMLRKYMADRPMNEAYLEQVGAEGKTWQEVRYGS